MSNDTRDIVIPFIFASFPIMLIAAFMIGRVVGYKRGFRDATELHNK